MPRYQEPNRIHITAALRGNQVQKQPGVRSLSRVDPWGLGRHQDMTLIIHMVAAQVATEPILGSTCTAASCHRHHPLQCRRRRCPSSQICHRGMVEAEQLVARKNEGRRSASAVDCKPQCWCSVAGQPLLLWDAAGAASRPANVAAPIRLYPQMWMAHGQMLFAASKTTAGRVADAGSCGHHTAASVLVLAAENCTQQTSTLHP